jgi:RNA polymerase sigma-70 factor (ECF subfamily)
MEEPAHPEESRDDTSLSPGLNQALSQLPPSQREAVELIHLEGLSVAEAADRAGTTPGALKVRAHRGYRALRALLRKPTQ